MPAVFVYGTLKSGRRNFGYLADASFLGYHATAAEFTLFDFGSYPAVHHAGKDSISGEIYRVNNEVLGCIDALEGYPEFFQRIEIDSDYGPVWMYVVCAELCVHKPVIHGGSW